MWDFVVLWECCVCEMEEVVCLKNLKMIDYRGKKGGDNGVDEGVCIYQ